MWRGKWRVTGSAQGTYTASQIINKLGPDPRPTDNVLMRQTIQRIEPSHDSW